MPGHIKLGTSVAGLADYILTDPRARVRELANPYAAKVGMGAGKYDDLTSWSAWVMDDWQRGVGREKAEDGGLAFSSVDSRVPNQLILPPAMGRVACYHGSTTNGRQQFFPADCTTYETVTIGVGRPFDTLLVRIETGSVTGTLRTIDLYARPIANAVGDTVTYEPMTWSDSGAAPDLKVSSGATTSVAYSGDYVIPRYQWMNAAATYTSYAGRTYYWVGFRVTAGMLTIVLGSNNTGSTTITGAGGAAPWTNSTDAIFQVCEDDEASPVYLPTRQNAWMGDTATGKTYVISDQNGTLTSHEYADATNSWTLKATNAATALAGSHCASWCGSVYVPASATSVSYMRYPEAGASFTTYGAVGGTTSFDGFAAGHGYLWGWDGNKVYYSNAATVTASSWVGPIEVGPTQFSIRSMCAFGDYMYIATDDALWYMGYGDVPIGVVRFPSRSSETGTSMVEFQGVLYVTVAGRVWQYSATGQVLDVWLPHTGDTGVQRGDVVALCSTGQNLYAVALPDTGAASDHQFYVYSWNGQGWHPVMIAQPPYGTSGGVTAPLCIAGTLYYGRAYNKLFLVSSPYNVYWARVPDSFLNPFRDTASKYMHTGYCTTPWFDGELIDVAKDYESFFITGEYFATNCHVNIYWQDDDSTYWEYLGRVDDAGEVVRWSSLTTRPNTKRIRFLLQFYTAVAATTPQVTGVRVKYRANVSDRWRWTIPVAVSANQQFPDGSINPQTPAQMRTALEGLARQVPPVVFQDVDGVQYNVWVTGCREQIVEYEYFNTAHQYQQQFLLSLEQCNIPVEGPNF